MLTLSCVTQVEALCGYMERCRSGFVVAGLRLTRGLAVCVAVLLLAFFVAHVLYLQLLHRMLDSSP